MRMRTAFMDDLGRIIQQVSVSSWGMVDTTGQEDKQVDWLVGLFHFILVNGRKDELSVTRVLVFL